jgi:FixJ family two-component response regulator
MCYPVNMRLEPLNTISTVFVVDDDHYVLKSIFEALRVTGLKIECFSSAPEFLAVVDAIASEGRQIEGCVVTDVKMPTMSGLQLQQELQSRGIRIPVIVISGQGDVPMVRTAMKLGALDFLEKPYAPRQLRELVLQAIECNAAQLRDQAQQKQVRDLLAQLTVEERQVVDGIVAGKTAKAISQDLGLSLRTIQFRRSSAMQKLNTTRSGLVEIVLRNRDAIINCGSQSATPLEPHKS